MTDGRTVSGAGYSGRASTAGASTAGEYDPPWDSQAEMGAGPDQSAAGIPAGRPAPWREREMYEAAPLGRGYAAR